MMYIQITTRCNMECEHCCYSCTSEGVDMPKEIYIKACELAEERGDTIAIGGGEPTIHPLFWEFLGLALAYHTEDLVLWMATNGKETETALRLAKLAKKGVISVDLSIDDYHEEIDAYVIDTFTPTRRGDYMSGHQDDFRGIRDVTMNGRRDPLPFGRAAGWATPNSIECVCNDLFIAPDGKIWACGCQQVQYGSVFDPQLPEEYPDEWCTSKFEELGSLHVQEA